jgi:hypothetical protein
VADITSNASLQSILQPGEVQLITTRACDCGTALDQRCEADVEVHTSPTEKLRKRGWSQSKIDRWLENKAKGELNAAKRSISRLPDSLAYWCNARPKDKSFPNLSRSVPALLQRIHLR